MELYCFHLFNFLHQQDVLNLRLTNKIMQQEMDNLIPPTNRKDNLSFKEKMRFVKKTKETVKHPKGNFFISSKMPLPPIYPPKKIPFFYRFLPSWCFGLLKKSFPLYFSKKEEGWKIGLSVKFKKHTHPEDILAIGISTKDYQPHLAGLTPCSLGWHLDDGIICYDGCILQKPDHYMPFNLAPDDTLYLEIDYLNKTMTGFINQEKISTYSLFGDFLWKKLFFVWSGQTMSSNEFLLTIYTPEEFVNGSLPDAPSNG